MRSRFFLGFVESREGAPQSGDEQAEAMRQERVTEEHARRLHQHATEEMGHLAEILPVFYRHATGDTAF